MSEGPQILIIDDERGIRKLLRLALESAHYKIHEAENATLGLQEAVFQKPDLIILDLGLPDMSGLDALGKLREWSQTPVIILSVRGEETTKVSALENGADDYVTKPFGTSELLARVSALLRRAKGSAANGEPVVSFGDCVLDLTTRQLKRNGLLVELTKTEYELLSLLARHIGKVLTHRQILKTIWGPHSEENTQYLRVYITHLRQKIEKDPSTPIHLITESGVGYRLI